MYLRVVLGLSWEAWDSLLSVDLGDQVSQTSGERGVTLVDATSALANGVEELAGIDGAGANSLGSTDVRTGG